MSDEHLEQDGILLLADVSVQCGGCNGVLARRILLPPDEVEDEVECPVCTAREGRPVFIPVAILVGAEVGGALDDAPADAGQPFAETGGVEVLEGLGPLQKVPA